MKATLGLLLLPIFTWAQAERTAEMKQSFELINKNFNLEVDKEIRTDFMIKNMDELKSKTVLEKEFVAATIVDDETESKKVYDTELEGLKKVHRLSGPTQFDSRIEISQLDPNSAWQLEILRNTESIAMIVEKEKLERLSPDFFYMDSGHTLGESFGLCRDEAFFSQPVEGIGTAFVYSENTMLTAKHVFNGPLKNYVIVFGYKILYANGVVENFFEKENIFYPQAIIEDFGALDVVEFSTDRPLKKSALQMGNSASMLPKDEIYMIGHPCGLPMKVAVNATVGKNSEPFYFYTTLDSFSGNSGSPVFSFKTNAVIGILVSGEVDYKSNGNCNYSPVCKMPYCEGEKAIRIENITSAR